MNGSKLDKVKNDINALIKECDNATNESPKLTDINEKSDVPDIPAFSYGRHKVINCASQCIDIAFSPEMGRHLVATHDILPGLLINYIDFRS